MSKTYSSKFIEFVKDVLYKYDGYVVKSDDMKTLVSYNPGFGSQYASIPTDLYNTLEKKSTKKNLPIKKSISLETIPKIIKEYKQDKEKREKKIQKKEEKKMEIETTIKGVPFLKREKEMKLFKNAMYRKLFYLHKIPITQSTVKFLTEQTWDLVEKKLNFLIMKNHHKFRGGYNTYIKLKASDYEGKQYFSFILRANNIKISDIRNMYVGITNKNYDTADYIICTNSIEMLVSPLSVKGGCSDRTHSERVKNEEEIMIVRSYKSKNNNCLIQCFNQYYGVNGNELKPDDVRKALGLPKGEKIDMKYIPKLSEYYNNK
jgi:hypothetical protein